MTLRNCLFCLFVILLSCGEAGLLSKLPMEKRYWDASDYDLVIRKIKFDTKPDEQYPTFRNPEMSSVIKKLTNTENFIVLLTDDQLGISHRSDVASKFFDEYRDMTNLYYKFDRQDKLVYGAELVAIQKFGLELQLHYFKLGNDNIIKDSDDPNSKEITRLLSSNKDVVYKNFNNYLDFVNNEDAFSDDDLNAYCEGIDKFFPLLFETFPNGNVGITEGKVKLMINKSKKDNVLKSLNTLLASIDRIKNPVVNTEVELVS